MIGRATRFRWRLSRIISFAALLGGLLSVFPWLYYYENLPRYPQPASGRVCPINMHGVIAYASRKERQRLNASEYAFFGCVAAGFVAAFLIIDELPRRGGNRPNWPLPKGFHPLK